MKISLASPSGGMEAASAGKDFLSIQFPQQSGLPRPRFSSFAGGLRHGGLNRAAPSCHCERSEAIPIHSLERDESRLGDCFVAPLLAMTSLLASPCIFVLRGARPGHGALIQNIETNFEYRTRILNDEVVFRRYNIIKRHSRSAFERESRLFLKNTGSPIKAFGDDEKNPVNAIERPLI